MIKGIEISNNPVTLDMARTTRKARCINDFVKSSDAWERYSRARKCYSGINQVYPKSRWKKGNTIREDRGNFYVYNRGKSIMIEVRKEDGESQLYRIKIKHNNGYQGVIKY